MKESYFFFLKFPPSDFDVAMQKTQENRREFLQSSGLLFLLSYCAEMQQLVNSSNPARMLSGLLSRDQGIVLNSNSLQHFILTSRKVDSTFLINTLKISIPSTADCRSEEWNRIAHSGADLLAEICTEDELQKQLLNLNNSPPLVQLIIYLALSRYYVLTDDLNNTTTVIEVIIPLEGEYVAAKFLRVEEHAKGESLITAQLRQLQWLFRNTQINWKLTYVDSSPDNWCGRAAQNSITEKLSASENIQFLLLNKTTTENKSLLSIGFLHARDSGAKFIFSGEPSIGTHLGHIGCSLRHLVSSRFVECVVSDTGHLNSYPPVKYTKEEKVFAFLFKQVYKSVIPWLVRHKPPLFGVTADAVKHCERVTQSTKEKGELLFFEMLFRIAYSAGREGAVKRERAIVIPPPETTPPKYINCLKHMYDAALTMSIHHSVLADYHTTASQWVDFIKSLDSISWATVLESSSAYIIFLQDGESLNRMDITVSDFKDGRLQLLNDDVTCMIEAEPPPAV